jgi:hypothetical protein
MAQFLGRYARRLARAPADLLSSQPSEQPIAYPRISVPVPPNSTGSIPQGTVELRVQSGKRKCLRSNDKGLNQILARLLQRESRHVTEECRSATWA